MNILEYKNIFLNEDSHFYYVGYHEIILSLIDRYLESSRKRLQILDVGCGTGLLTKKLEKFGEVVGVDINLNAIKYAKMRGVKVKKASILKLPFKNNSFDLIILADVLNHKSIKKDSSALKEIYRILKLKGLLIIKLPAFNFLSGNHDVFVYTRKRYNKMLLDQILRQSFFNPIKITYLASFLFLPVLFRIQLEKIRKMNKPSSSIFKTWQPLNKLLILLFNLENKIINHIDLPFGISILAVARK